MVSAEQIQPDVSFVIPAYGSSQTLGGVLDEVFEAFPQSEAIVVVDGSPDDVASRARDYAREHSQRAVTVVELRQNRGQHFAILQGFKRVRAPLVATIDDDGQNPAAEILHLIAKMEEGDFDCVYGATLGQKAALHRRILSGLNKRLSAYFMRNVDRIPISNVRLLRRDLATFVLSSPAPQPFVDSLIFHSTRHIGWAPVAHRTRAAGSSGYTLGSLIRLGISHTTTLSTKPLMIGGAAISAVALVVLCYAATILVRSLANNQAPPGWASQILLTTTLFSVLFGYLTLIGIYLGRLYVGTNSSYGVYLHETETGAPATPGRGETE